MSKKNKPFVVIMCLLFGCLTLASCSKEGSKADDRLVGTKWQTSDFVYELLFGGTAYDVYEFISSTEVENYTTQNGNVVDMNGTYKYDLEYPNITIYSVNSDGETTPLDFVFRDSRTMIRAGEDINEYASYMKYTRQ